jgi:hypothetical protein
VIEDVLRQVTVRIDEADPAAGFDVLKNEITKESGLSGASLTNDIEVLPTFW